MTDRDRIRAERKKLKERYGDVFDEISAILFTIDPVGINFRTNTDEYDPEVGTILPRLTECGSATDVRRVVFEEFCSWFGAGEAGSETDYTEGSRLIWEAWTRSQSA